MSSVIKVKHLIILLSCCFLLNINLSFALARSKSPNVSIQLKNQSSDVSDQNIIPVNVFFTTDKEYSIYSILIENSESYIT